MMILLTRQVMMGQIQKIRRKRNTILPQTQKKWTLIRRSPGLMTQHLQKVQITGFVTNFLNIVRT
jgi:hypothetical protein